ncbi:MAG: hypothetical protein QOD67_5003 [Caballeronia sp.]|nr:hypothetical protein [Caballeronia sp.]
MESSPIGGAGKDPRRVERLQAGPPHEGLCQQLFIVAKRGTAMPERQIRVRHANMKNVRFELRIIGIEEAQRLNGK